ncbi:MAG: hypothetical protein OEV44_08850 [Spirochaetota bacterium]|nr:hypothetical protein [Spirochaetota bacterium]
MANHLEKVKQQKKMEKQQNPFARKGAEFKDHEIHTELSDDIPESLEEIESQLQKLSSRVQECGWLIGKRLIEIRDKHLITTNYENIHSYAFEKFSISKNTCYNLIFVAQNFSRVQVLVLGSKLYLLRALDEIKRKNYLEWMEKEKPSFQAVENKIKSEQQKPGRPREDISFTKTSVKINLQNMGIKLSKEKKQAFKNELKLLIEKYSDLIGGEIKLNV